MMGLRTPSVNSGMAQKLGQWLTDQRAVQPSRGTSTGWRGPERNLMAFNKEKSRMLLLGRNSHRNLRAPSWKAALQKRI